MNDYYIINGEYVQKTEDGWKSVDAQFLDLENEYGPREWKCFRWSYSPVKLNKLEVLELVLTGRIIPL